MPQDQITNIMAEFSIFTEKTMIALVLNLTDTLVTVTPKDTGFASQNWIPGISPFEVDLTDINKREQKIELTPQISEIRNTRLLNLLGGYKLSQGSIYIVNNVPYIIDLNDGSSRKAPAAFVQSAIESTITEVGGKIRG